jgi:hypothetical protein
MVVRNADALVLHSQDLIANAEQPLAPSSISLLLEVHRCAGVAVRCCVLPDEVLVQEPIEPLVGVEMPNGIQRKCIHLPLEC